MDVNADLNERRRAWIVKRLLRLEQLYRGFSKELDRFNREPGPLDVLEQRRYRSVMANIRIAIWNAKLLLQEVAEREQRRKS